MTSNKKRQDLDIIQIVNNVSDNPNEIREDETNFEKVVKFNKLFGVPIHKTPELQICNTKPNLVKLRLALILEEVQELQDAHRENDFPEIIDAMADILYVVYGMGASYGVNLDKAFERVHRSNMSKLCKTEQEAKDTVAWYKNQANTGKNVYDSPTYRKGNDAGDYWVVFNKSTGKILKNINYKAVDFLDYRNLFNRID